MGRADLPHQEKSSDQMPEEAPAEQVPDDAPDAEQGAARESAIRHAREAMRQADELSDRTGHNRAERRPSGANAGVARHADRR